MEKSLFQELMLQKSGQLALGLEEFALLRAIHAEQSLKQAALQLEISYKKAWLMLERMNNLSKSPLTSTLRGGAERGQTCLTEAGTALLGLLEELSQLTTRVVERYAVRPSLAVRANQGFHMKISARNQFFGRINAIQAGPVFANVEVALSGGERVVASITQDALEDLGLAVGQEVYALIKSSHVLLAEPLPNLKISTRNRYLGEVVELFEGKVNDEVVLKVKGDNLITSSITKESTQTLGLSLGSPAMALFKASSVILMTL